MVSPSQSVATTSAFPSMVKRTRDGCLDSATQMTPFASTARPLGRPVFLMTAFRLAIGADVSDTATLGAALDNQPSAVRERDRAFRSANAGGENTGHCFLSALPLLAPRPEREDCRAASSSTSTQSPSAGGLNCFLPLVGTFPPGFDSPVRGLNHHPTDSLPENLAHIDGDGARRTAYRPSRSRRQRSSPRPNNPCHGIRPGHRPRLRAFRSGTNSYQAT